MKIPAESRPMHANMLGVGTDGRAAVSRRRSSREGGQAMTEFTIGTEASCSDGHVGRLSRVIVEPGTQAVTHLVIEPRHRPERGRIVPVDLAEATAGEIKLRCTKAEFGKFDPAEETDLLPDATGDPVYDTGVGPDLGDPRVVPSLAIANLRLPGGPRVTKHDAVPRDEVDVRRGEQVYATDGAIGRIQGLVIDSGSHHVTHILLEEGHLWGRKEVAIPIGAMTRVDDVIKLTIDKHQVQGLPTVDIEHLAG
jgi:sporulation protein YlmC with PRC-barrel domain